MPVRYGWSLETSDWEVANAATGPDSSKGTYLESGYEGRVPEKVGIYMLCAKPRGPLGTRDFLNVLYVGKATNLRSRFQDHQAGRNSSPLIKRCKRVYSRMHFHWMAMPETINSSPEEWMKNTEQALIAAFGPPANKYQATRAVIGIGRPAG